MEASNESDTSKIRKGTSGGWSKLRREKNRVTGLAARPRRVALATPSLRQKEKKLRRLFAQHAAQVRERHLHDRAMTLALEVAFRLQNLTPSPMGYILYTDPSARTREALAGLGQSGKKQRTKADDAVLGQRLSPKRDVDELVVSAVGVLEPGTRLALHSLDVQADVYLSVRLPNYRW